MNRQQIASLSHKEIKSFPKAQRYALIRRSNHRWDLLTALSHDSVCFGLFWVNTVYLGLVLFFMFGVFTHFVPSFNYFFTTLCASLVTIVSAEMLFEI